MRRVVTGLGPDGRSRIVGDGQARVVCGGPGCPAARRASRACRLLRSPGGRAREGSGRAGPGLVGCSQRGSYIPGLEVNIGGLFRVTGAAPAGGVAAGRRAAGRTGGGRAWWRPVPVRARPGMRRARRGRRRTR